MIAKMLAAFALIYLGVGTVTATYVWRECRRQQRPELQTRYLVQSFLRFAPAIVFCWPFPQWFR